MDLGGDLHTQKERGKWICESLERIIFPGKEERVGTFTKSAVLTGIGIQLYRKVCFASLVGYC